MVKGITRTPDLPGLKDFAGHVVHSHGFRNGSAWRGKKALVPETGNSGHGRCMRKAIRWRTAI